MSRWPCYSYREFKGEIPAGMVIDHLCRKNRLREFKARRFVV